MFMFCKVELLKWVGLKLKFHFWELEKIRYWKFDVLRVNFLSNKKGVANAQI